MVRILGMVWLMVGVSHAKDFGVQGATYPVSEESLLQHITHQLAQLPDSVLYQKQLEVQARVKQSIVAPTPVAGVQKATTYRTVTYDPSITLIQDLKDHHGRIIAAKGSRYNPLAQLHLKDTLVIFDGTDPEQVTWAVGQGEHTKWILTAGRPFDLMKAYDRTVYFDQGGALCRQLNIKAVPVQVRQHGTVLHIEEGLQTGDDHAH